MFMFACDEKEDPPAEAKVMQVSLNPKVEFVLNTENNVVSVTALNDEGYAVLTGNVDYSNLSAEDAVDLFLATAEEKGFVVEGMMEDGLTISISGETAQELYKKVKDSATAKLSELGVTVTINGLDQITKEELQTIAKNYFKDQTDIANKSVDELANMVKQAHIETEDIVSTKLKDLYFAIRQVEVIAAKYQAVADINPLLTTISTQITELKEMLSGQEGLINEFIEKFYTTGTGTYQAALDAYNDAKELLIEANVNGTVNQELKTAVEQAETTLKTIETTANIAMNTVLASVENAANAIVTVTNELLNTNSTLLELANTAISNVNIDNVVANIEAEFLTDGDYVTYNVNVWVQTAA